jgi:hypothetical protein
MWDELEGAFMKLVMMGAVVLMGVAAASAQAAVSISVASSDVGSGLTQYILTAHANDATYGINAFDVTITGDLNQVHPASLDTTFQDLNVLMPNPDLDTQFLFLSANSVIAPNTSFDTTSTLASAFSTGAAAYSDVAFVQVVVPTGSSFHYDAQIAVNDALGTATSLQGSVPVPEPASLGLLAVGGLALLRRRRR